MAKIVDMPKLSPTMEEGQIAAWHKKEGDSVGVDDLLAEVETDKATMEFRSFDKGTLLKILVQAGDIVKLGQPVAIIGAAGEDISALAVGGDQSNAAASAAAPAALAAPAAPAAREVAPASNVAPAAQPSAAASAPAGTAAAPTASADGRIKASPYVRKLARERGLELSVVAGSGPNGRIVMRDLDGSSAAAGLQRRPVQGHAESEAPEVRPLSMMRKTIARRLTESKQNVPHFYLTIDVDAGKLTSLRSQINLDLAASLGDAAPKVSFNDLVVRAVAIGLTRVPECNAQFTPEALVFHKRVDLSIAVAVDDGLVTPVVRDADQKGVLELASEIRDLAKRARDKKLRPEEMQNGTFSVSNLGMFGIDEFSAVINPPEGAILAVGAVRKEPVVLGDAVVVGHRMAMTMSCDHRVIDGAVGAKFLKALRGLLEHPTQILLG